MAPVIQELEKREIPYNYLDTGQHAGLTADLGEQFNLRSPNVFLRQGTGNISTFFQALTWSLSTLWRILFKKKKTCKDLFQGRGGVCLIHGDTLTTLFSLLYAKRCGLKVAHVEAGLRSFELFNPFPEEIIRLLAMRFSDVLFAPSPWAKENLKRMGYGEKTISVGGNTIVDALRYARTNQTLSDHTMEPYALVTIHRVETIYSRKRMEKITSLLSQITSERQVLFVLHEPTKHQLDKFGLLNELEKNPRLLLLPLQPYLKFVSLIDRADFVITDGGSIQEETHYLNVPCLIMRTKTERQEGLEENAVISDFDPERISQFLATWKSYQRSAEPQWGEPSSKLVDYLQEMESTAN